MITFSGRFFAGTGTSTAFDDGAAGPEVEQRVDELVEGIRLRGDAQDLVQEDVRLQRSHEDEGGSARVAGADDAGRGGAAEIVGDDAQPLARRRVALRRLEGKDDGARLAVHVEGEVLLQRVLDEGNEMLGDVSEDRSRIGLGVGRFEGADEVGNFDAAAHRGVEQLLLRLAVPQHGGRGDVQFAGDVGERGGLETLRGEDAAGGLEELIAGNGRRPSHR
jgi:hypothetical protein